MAPWALMAAGVPENPDAGDAGLVGGDLHLSARLRVAAKAFSFSANRR